MSLSLSILQAQNTLSRRKDGSYSGRFVFLENDIVFKGHYPFYPVFPASLIVELSYKLISESLNINPVQLKGFKVKKSAFYIGFSVGDIVDIELSFSQKNTDLEILFYKDGDLGTRLVFAQGVHEPSSVAIKEINPEKYSPAHTHLPQRFPLLVVDRVYADKEMGSALKYISYSDHCYQHTSCNEIAESKLAYPLGGVIEGLEQSAVMLLAEHWDVVSQENPIVVCSIDGVEYYQDAFPGEVIRYTSVIDYISDNTAFLSGWAASEGRQLLKIDKLIVVRKEDAIR